MKLSSDYRYHKLNQEIKKFWQLQEKQGGNFVCVYSHNSDQYSFPILGSWLLTDFSSKRAWKKSLKLWDVQLVTGITISEIKCMVPKNYVPPFPCFVLFLLYFNFQLKHEGS